MTQPDSKISITINVNGTVITGDLVSVKKFHMNLRETVLDNLKEKDDRNLFRRVVDVFEKLENVPLFNENGSFISNYLCIENPKIYQQAGNYTYNPPYWIGKMESVNGFSLGEFDEISGS